MFDYNVDYSVKFRYMQPFLHGAMLYFRTDNPKTYSIRISLLPPREGTVIHALAKRE